ncbi:MAG: hypothetical protein A2083_05920 [Gemmatimonadetes bacterium GWC2_71_9]|nr:MAG: hypothetical protein A2083_05920 [Gemmatimonadetes bacterium GWC2_71_9]
MNTNRPPGFNTRRTSLSVAAGSATEHSTSVLTTASTLASWTSRRSAAPSLISIVRPRRAASFLRYSCKYGLGSTPIQRTSGR